MATLKISEVSGKINTGRNPGPSRLALPLSLATNQAAGFKQFSDQLINIYASQKKEEDNNEAMEITNGLSIDLIQSYNKHSNNTNLEIALEGFNGDVNYSNFKDLGSNKRVKEEVKNYVNKFQRKYSLDLLGKVTTKHKELTKARKTQTLNGYVKDISTGGANGLIAERDYNTFLTNPDNLSYYGPEALEKLKQDKDLEILELTYINGGKSGKINLMNNEQRAAVLESLPVKSQKAVIDKIRNNIVSEGLKLKEEQVFAEKKDKQLKITTFTTALLSINDVRLNATEENIARNPSLDDLYDLKHNGALNSAQYETLLRFKADDKKLDDVGILQIVNAQFALADSVEKIDSLQEDVNLNPDITAKLTPASIIKFNKLADKYKSDTTFGIEDKKFRELIDIGSKRVLKTSGTLKIFSSGKSADYDFLVRAEARLSEYDDLTLNKNFTPEQAYAEVIKKFKKDELPELHDLEQPKSVSISNYKEQLAAHPKDTFNTLRNEVAIAFKKHGDIEIYKDDLRKVDVIEDTYETRVVVYGDVKKAIGKEFKSKED